MNIPFMDYVSAVDDLLLIQYGINHVDLSLDMLAAAQESGDTPQDCVSWIAQKYDLEELT